MPRSVIFVGVPTEKGSFFRKGIARAPLEIRRASMRYYYKGMDCLYDPNYDDYFLTGLKIFDLGDLIDNGRLESEITNTIRKISGVKSLPIILGGDHSISYFAVAAFLEKIQILHLDAHADFQRYDESDAAPCGVVMRKISGLKNVLRVCHVGIRGYLNSGQGIHDSIRMENCFLPSDLLIKNGVGAVLENLIPKLPVYISFDTDVLDPSICPGTTVPEMSGLSYSLCREIISAVAKNFRVLGLDFVEMNPRFDQNKISSFCVSQLIIDSLASVGLSFAS